MSEQPTPPIDLGELRQESPTPGGILNLTDILEAFRPTNPAAPQNGGTSHGATLAELTNLVLGNISTTQLNTMLRRSVAARVAAAGASAATIPGRIGLSVTRATPGRYVIQNAENLTFFSMAASVIGGSNRLTHTISGLNSDTVTIDWRDANTGTLTNCDFAIMAELT